ncbi:hypothetical protein CVR96_27500, partial [Salmonella enterica subsp. enterica serovar Typhimurium]|uniref:hypothetical protein n=1 Tax=Salmonella enterica TaxID=28901 RepID=UPI000CAA35E8
IGLTYHLGKENRRLHKSIGRYLLAAPTLAGATAGMVGPTSGLLVDSMIAFSSGAMIFNVISKEIPFEKNT